MSGRADIHRPSLADPADYAYVGCFYQGSSDAMHDSYMLDHRDLANAIGELGLPQHFNGNHLAKGTCDHCGAAFAHGVVFFHEPTRELVSIGHICASNTIGLPSRAAAAKKSAERAAAEEAERLKRQEETAEWRELNADVVAFLVDKEMGEATAHPFLVDMYRTMNRYGKLSDGQAAAVAKFIANEGKYAARQAAEAAKVKGEFQEGKLTLRGRVLSTKWKENMYGGALKMLVELEDFNRVWGTVPAALQFGGGDDELVGKTVEFTATVERSRDDEHFGFYSRPTKAALIEEGTDG
jgi:hypothetical protein